MTAIIFSHGKESGPTGRKINALAQIAKAQGFQTLSPDYRDLSDPQARTDRLIGIASRLDACVLVGSSMGGYASLMASTQITACAGLFLLAPAIGLSGYHVADPARPQCNVDVVHGWHDHIVPVDNIIDWSQRNCCTLHLLDDDHRLGARIELLADLFGVFLRRLAKDQA